MKNDERLHKWVNGELSEEELQEFRQRPEYASLERLRQSLEQLDAPALQEEEILQAILKAPKEDAQVRKLPGLTVWLSVAASIAIILLTWVYVLKPPTIRQVATTTGEHLEERMPDESLIVLNAESQVTYQEDDWDEHREIQLQGEAYFDVAHGSKFSVQTEGGEVLVLGTQFNVRSRDGELEVSCYSGKVAVLGGMAVVAVRLEAGQAIRLDKTGAKTSWEVPENQRMDHLVQGSRTSLQEVSLSRVLQEMERQYGVSFKTNNVDASRVLSTGFPNDNLEQALQLVFGSLRIRYTQPTPTQVNLFQE